MAVEKEGRFPIYLAGRVDTSWCWIGSRGLEIGAKNPNTTPKISSFLTENWVTPGPFRIPFL